jgi:guanylate kinase
MKGKPYQLKMESKGNLFIVSAPSGSGKTTLCRKLASDTRNLKYLVSFTTRPKRKGEINNKDYTFISEEKFNKMIKAGRFVEWANVHGHLYGTSRERLENMLGKGIDVILDIDTKGARQLRKKYPEATYMFILPPSLEVLKQRLNKRKSDSKSEIEKRLKSAAVEIRDYKNYDYVIINNVFEDALERLQTVVLQEKMKTQNIDTKWINRVFLKKGK